jgi:predicted NAD-dependent protein-ADP-ribosyltransferase YbiA (DUF1768 family)
VRNAPTAKEAFEIAHASSFVASDFFARRDAAMKDSLLLKFSQNTALLQALKNLDSAPIHEDSPRDLYWGCRSNGQDRLGRLLSEVRATLKDAEIPVFASPPASFRETSKGLCPESLV